MKERPMLFSAPMVCALLDGTKTQTRRVVKPLLSDREWVEQRESSGFWRCADGEPTCYTGVWETNEYAQQFPVLCPQGQPGDCLVVRETFFAWGRWETQFSAKKGRDEWHFVDMTLEAGKSYAYASDGLPAGYAKHHDGRGGITPTWWKRPAIFMPRAASRITLEVTGVRVERLQDISEADAAAEGCEPIPFPGPWWQGYRRDDDGELHHQQATGETPPDWMVEPKRMKPMSHLDRSARDAFRLIWLQINGLESWDANPWVWCISFRRIDQ
jgi:hypothetical protein